tara:strand:+ start:360 stop:596 length:237 start_codon:yes stop_codon:yes gene_type:complete
MDINKLIEGLSAEQIRAVIASISKQGNVRKIDRTRRANRIARTELYFSSCPKPHMVDSFETYNNHADSIREQVLSGVE